MKPVSHGSLGQPRLVCHEIAGRRNHQGRRPSWRPTPSDAGNLEIGRRLGAAIGPPVLVLTAWALVGIALDLVAWRQPHWAIGLPRRSRPASAVA
jgi:hypothetical protein